MIPDRADPADLDMWLDGEPRREWQREQLAFAAMGYLGMCRHLYLSPDWVAHNGLWCDSCQALSKIIDPSRLGGAEKKLTDRLVATYQARGFICNNTETRATRK